MELQIAKRTIMKKATRVLRRQDQIPAVIYASHLDTPISIQCRRQDFVKLYKEGGSSTPITLVGDGINQMVLVQDMQLDPVSMHVLHVDFQAIKKGEKVTADVILVLVGEAPVEKSKEGRVQQVKDTVSVEAVPTDLPHDLQVDVSVLETTNDVLFVKDIILPKGVEIQDDPEQAIVTIASLKGADVEDDIVGVGDAAEDAATGEAAKDAS